MLQPHAISEIHAHVERDDCAERKLHEKRADEGAAEQNGGGDERQPQRQFTRRQRAFSFERMGAVCVDIEHVVYQVDAAAGEHEETESNHAGLHGVEVCELLGEDHARKDEGILDPLLRSSGAQQCTGDRQERPTGCDGRRVC